MQTIVQALQSYSLTGLTENINKELKNNWKLEGQLIVTNVTEADEMYRTQHYEYLYTQMMSKTLNVRD